MKRKKTSRPSNEPSADELKKAREREKRVKEIEERNSL